MGESAARDVCRSDAAGLLPLQLVAGTHSGRNATCLAAIAASTAGRVLWLTGPLQRPLARAALDTAMQSGHGAPGPGGRPLRARLDLDSLPGGCPCCAAGPALGVGLARLLGKRRRAGTAPDAMAIQLEPEGDPAMLADRLREAPCDTMVRLDAIVAVVSAAELAALDPAHAAPRALRCAAAAGWVVVAPPDDTTAVMAAARAAAPLIGPGWSGALRPLPAAQGQANGRADDEADGGAGAASTSGAWAAALPAGWTVLVQDPFGADAADRPWQLVARWSAAERFDRRGIADWLARIGAVPGVEEVGFVGRTERQWLGWRSGRAEIPLAWRTDSRLAVRLASADGPGRSTAISAASDLAKVIPHEIGVIRDG